MTYDDGSLDAPGEEVEEAEEDVVMGCEDFGICPDDEDEEDHHHHDDDDSAHDHDHDREDDHRDDTAD
jgi:hypothetical protein